jgi:hypothetical protein
MDDERLDSKLSRALPRSGLPPYPLETYAGASAATAPVSARYFSAHSSAQPNATAHGT